MQGIEWYKRKVNERRSTKLTLDDIRKTMAGVLKGHGINVKDMHTVQSLRSTVG